jgi:hypothetical protein
MSSFGPSEENPLADTINPYMRELKMHPKELLLKDGELQIKDAQGPKGEGSLEARMEALKQEVFKYKKMAEREVDIIHRINQELVTKYKKETTELWRTSFRSMRPLTSCKHNSTTCRTKTVSRKLGLNK